MFRYLNKFIKKQKLLIGILWLMLRGNGANAQEIKMPENLRCYKPVNPKVFSKRSVFAYSDISIAEKVYSVDLSDFSTTIQLGHNFRKTTMGAEFELPRKDENIFIGPYFRVFPFDEKRPLITYMMEIKYLFSPEKPIVKDAFSISTGFIISEHGFGLGSLGFEVFESMTTDISVPSGVSFYTGIRIHYYIKGF